MYRLFDLANRLVGLITIIRLCDFAHLIRFFIRECAEGAKIITSRRGRNPFDALKISSLFPVGKSPHSLRTNSCPNAALSYMCLRRSGIFVVTNSVLYTKRRPGVVRPIFPSKVMLEAGCEHGAICRPVCSQ